MVTCHNCPKEIETFAQYFTENCEVGGSHYLYPLESFQLPRVEPLVCAMPECSNFVSSKTWAQARVDELDGKVTVCPDCFQGLCDQLLDAK